MDSLTLDAAVAAVCIALGIATWYRKPPTQTSLVPSTVPIARSIRHLRRRHRRAVRAIVELAGECLERHPDGSFESYTAREALRTYLPETLSAYLAVPRPLRRVSRGARPSADDELSRQLRVLLNGLERIQAADAEVAVTRMATNGAFLAERFAAPELPRAPKRRSTFGELVEVLETTLHRG